MEEFVQKSIKNHMRYAQDMNLNFAAAIPAKQGFDYGYFKSSGSGRDFDYNKFAVIQYLFDRGSDYVMWVDSDAVFMHKATDVRKFVSENSDKDFLFTGAFNFVMNAGVFIIRNSEWSTSFMRKSFDAFPAPGVWEDQSSMVAVLGGAEGQPIEVQRETHRRLERRCGEPGELAGCTALLAPEAQKHVVLLPQESINAFLTDADAVPQPVPLVVHLAGRSDKSQKLDLLTRLSTV